MDERAKGAQEWFRKATEAMNHQNWDYAVECLTNCVRLVPANVMYRQTRHGNLRKKYGDNGTGARMAGVKLMSVKGKLKKSRMQKDWKNLDLLAEEGLMVNPWDAALYFDLGEANLELENFEVAKYALHRAVELDQGNVDYNRRYGHFLHQQRDYKGSEACFRRIQKVIPTDTESRSMINTLQAESVMDRGGYGNAETTRDVKAEQQAPVNAYEQDRIARKGGSPKPADAPGESAEADLLHAIRKEPQNVNTYLKLSDHYRGVRDLRKAQDTLKTALEVSNNDPDIAEQLEDVQLSMMRNDLAETEERMRKNPGKERLVEKFNSLTQELLHKELDVFSRRIDRHPSDMKMRYELALRYIHVQQWPKAITLLQQATSDNRLKSDALVALGDCFRKDKKLDLARRQYERALEAMNAQDKPDAFRNSHYWLGRIYEQAKKLEQAEHHYHEILAVDYDYKDVLKRVEDMQSQSGGDSVAD